MDLASLKPSDPAYWEAVRRVEPPSWPDEHPHPIVTSRDPWPADFEKPAAVVKLEQELRAYGFRVRSTYSRGFQRAIKVGTYTEIHAVAVRFATDGRMGYAVYVTPVKRTAWAWKGIGLSRPGSFPYQKANRTDLGEWVALRGLVLPGWFRNITKRVEEQEKRQKEAARSRTKKGNQDVS